MTNKSTDDNVATETDVVVEEPKTKKPKDPHTVVNIYGDVSAVDVTSSRFERSTTLGSGAGSDIVEFTNKVDAVDNPNLVKEYTEEELISVGYNTANIKSVYTEGPLSNKIPSDGYVNHATVDGKKLGMRFVEPAAKGHLSGADAVAAFTSKLSIGKHASITLWHSGFTLLLLPPKESDVINLQYNISKQEHRLGMDTNNMIYSNYGVVANKLILDFVMRQVAASSLVLPDDKSYLDFILASDINQLEMTMLGCMRSGTYPLTMTCGNSLDLDADNKPVCDFTASLDIDPENTIWVRRKALTTDLLVHISKTSAGSHTAESVLEYQAKLEQNTMKTYTVGAGDREITVDIKTPTVRKYLDSGTLWVNRVIADTEAILSVDDDVDMRENKLTVMVNASLLNRYSSYIERISTGAAYVDDVPTIIDVLATLSSDTDVVNDMYEAVNDYINNAYISLVATYNFDCPKCLKADREQAYTDGEVTRFKEFIPVNVAEHFFAHSALIMAEVVDRDQ